MSAPASCPCGSGAAYDACCGPYHQGEQLPSTAVALMRSRFAAFAVHDEDYLRQTWHPDNRPAEVDTDDGTEWRRLHIVDTELGGPDDDTGAVEFVARYRRNGQSGSMRERSEFVRLHGRWLYLRGTVLP